MKLRRHVVALSTGLLVLFSVQAGRAACNETECTFSGDSEALECLEYAASFAGEGSVRGRVVDSDWSFTSQGAGPGGNVILPLSHESPGSALSRYRAACVHEIISYASDPGVLARSYGPRILYEASFRRASAHGMFGDDRLLRALNAALDPNSPSLLGDSIQDALVHFDSRICRPDSGTPGTFDSIGAFESLCQSGRDCGFGEVCAAARFDDGQTGLFGAIQEYRLGEQAILELIQRIGPDLFEKLELTAVDDCGGVGCASRLLVRLGALRSLAQAERLELQWRRVFAQGALLDDELVCSAGDLDASCAMDVDCNTTSPADGVCGSSEKERALVAVRQAAEEALAEAAAAMSLYRSIAPEAISGGNSDMAMLSNALEQISNVATRSSRATTPFGVPASYVPFLSDAQRGLLGCDASVSVFGCLQFLLEDDAVGVLQALDDPANQAPLELDAYADAIRTRGQEAVNVRNQFEDVLDRMFGASCEGSGCTCSDSERGRGECVKFETSVWIIEGVRCSNPDDPFASCSTSGVDGALEQQIQVMRNAQVALDNIAGDIRRNAETQQHTIESFLTQEGIVSERCDALEAAFIDAGNRASNAISHRRATIGGGSADAAATALAAGSVLAASAATGPGVAVGAAAAAGMLAFAATQAGKMAQEEERREDLELQQVLRDIETNQQIASNRIQCAAEVRQIREVALPDALFNIESQLLSHIARAKEQRGTILQAEIAVNQLVAEIKQARQRYDQAVELQEIWDDQNFRNPQNYRALALEKQLKAADALRRAQLVSWFLLRAVAYDLARPDTVSPLRQHGSGTVIELGNCSKARCAGNHALSCITEDECGAFGPCQSSAEPSDIADSDGSCSLQAVFAARDVEDLRSLIRSAFIELALTFRDTACDDDVCDKTVRLRDIFEDALDPGQPPLGEILRTLPLSETNEATLEFGISLQRGFNVCPSLPDLSLECQPQGIAGLVDDESGPGDDASDFWNARLISVEAAVRFRQNREPNANLCRNPADGRPVGRSPAQECFGVLQGRECPFTTECRNAAGGSVPCRCSKILNGDPNVDLIQAGPGLVRTRASRVSRDAFISYEMRTGDLPDVDSDPDLNRFQLSNMKLRSTLEQSVPDESARGIPLASPRWQLRLKPTGLLTGAFMSEYLTSIEDIQLRFNYEAFNLPP